MKIFRFLLITVTVAALVSCGAQKKITEGNDNVDNNPIANTQIDNDTWLGNVLAMIGGWTTMKTNGHLNVKGGGKSFSSAMQIRMERDKIIYISLRPVLGIEVGRLIIREDSLIVVNKLQKLYLAEKVSLLTAGLPATVSMMQDMFLGRPHIVGEGTLNASRRSMAKVVEENDKRQIQPATQPSDFTYAFNYDADSHILSLDVRLNKGDGAYRMTYGDVQRTLAGDIAHTLCFATDIKGKPFALDMDYDRITWNETLDTSFSIPTGYKRQDARSLMSIFQ